ncbi:uncharacterized protein LOC110986522 [Acanthaster planci]|uniref:Uncharacterized protein LOC110986522 n=1 Tax=Acanthaster planci TaxID=133434 RepID=A0A8B7ZEQ4_ACAPL|nr:uncharacterized protein LOC110986522 [Acanthaster planci]XP_022104138.1 uncharacterized protein LOC110986522 [Acanthaster planci]
MARSLIFIYVFLVFLTISTLIYEAILSGYSSSHSFTESVALPKHRVFFSNNSYLLATKSHTLTLTLRMAAAPKLIHRLYCVLLRSAVLFWSPKLGHISVILDKESAADHRLAARLSQQEHAFGVKFDFIYEPLPNDISILKIERDRGYSRQLWSSFFMDLYIHASIIAWIDTDGMFTTPVTSENIFNDHQLRVVTFTDWNIPRKHGWDKTTKLAMGMNLMADFMTYFPVYIWRDTVRNCREHILRHMNVSNFEDAFRKLKVKRARISPVNILLNYAYYFEHDRYDWHLDVNNNLEAYNTQHLAPGFEIKPNETVPDVRVTVHAGKHFVKAPNPMLQGYCIAKGHVGTVPTACKMFENVTNFQLFEFLAERGVSFNHLATWCSPKGDGRKDCSRRIEAHYKNVGRYYNLGWFDLDLRRVSAVEKAAALLNVTCPKIFHN